MSHYLSIILFTPLAGALLLLLVNKQNENAIRWIANIVALIGFVISVPLWFWFNPQSAGFSSSSARRGFRRSAPSTSSASTASARC